MIRGSVNKSTSAFLSLETQFFQVHGGRNDSSTLWGQRKEVASFQNIEADQRHNSSLHRQEP